MDAGDYPELATKIIARCKHRGCNDELLGALIGAANLIFIL